MPAFLIRVSWRGEKVVVRHAAASVMVNSEWLPLAAGSCPDVYGLTDRERERERQRERD